MNCHCLQSLPTVTWNPLLVGSNGGPTVNLRLAKALRRKGQYLNEHLQTLQL